MTLLESQLKLKNGDQAPDFKLQGVDGKTYSLSDFSGKPGKQGALIIFMCNHCPYVKAKVEAMKDLQHKFGDKISIVGINSNDPDYPDEGMDNMKKHVADWDLNFTYLIDDTQKIAKDYGAVCTPDPFLFDKDFKLVFHGRINDAMSPDATAQEHTMEEVITNLLSGRKISNEFKPSMGCSIKWIEPQ